MSPLELPKTSKPLVIVAAIAFTVALCSVCTRDDADPLSSVISLLISAFFADMFTGLAHFGFDYMFPEKMPILGPIAREFRAHHEHPMLDPSNYPENLTKGSYCSLPLSLVVILLSNIMPSATGAFLLLATLLGMSFWAYFFHQIHSYAHMGSTLSANELNVCVGRIKKLTSKKQQIEEFSKLFDTIPIPAGIRLLQKCRIILSPQIHNLHHIQFETDFSSVNGWSDPLLNLVLGPIARRLKAMKSTSSA